MADESALITFLSAHGVTGALISFALGIIRWWFLDLKRAVECQGQKQQDCRESLDRRFAAKDDLGKAWARIDEHTADIGLIKGALGIKQP